MKKIAYYFILFFCSVHTVFAQNPDTGYIRNQATVMQNATAWVSGKFTSSFVQTFRGTSGSTNGVSHHDFFGGAATPAGANARWSFNLQGLESANNAGSDFRIWSYKDDGTFLTNPFSISRALGIVSIPIGLAATTINTNNTTGLLSVYGGASGPNSYRGAEIMFRGGGYSTTLLFIPALAVVAPLSQKECVLMLREMWASGPPFTMGS